MTYKTKERNEMIYKLKKAGFTYKELGDKYGISKERVRQICEKESRIEREGELFPLCDAMDVKIHRAFRRYGIDTTEKILELSYNDVIRMRNLGEQSADRVMEIQCELRRRKN